MARHESEQAGCVGHASAVAVTEVVAPEWAGPLVVGGAAERDRLVRDDPLEQRSDGVEAAGPDEKTGQHARVAREHAIATAIDAATAVDGHAGEEVQRPIEAGVIAEAGFVKRPRREERRHHATLGTVLGTEGTVGVLALRKVVGGDNRHP